MFGYIIRRLIQSLIVVGIVSYVCFFLMSFLPGDPIDLLNTTNPQLTSSDIERLRHLYELDAPISMRYWSWAQKALQGDFGYSRANKLPVTKILWSPLVNTCYLSLSVLILSLVFAIPCGVLSALKKETWIDRAIQTLASVSLATPSFWLGYLLILAFSVYWPLLPPGGTVSIGFDNSTFFDSLLDRLTYLILPTLSLSFLLFGRFVPFIRTTILDNLQHDFVQTAMAKGLTKKTIFWRHIFKNSMLPLITLLSLSLSSLFSGALITETVFSYQGMGKLFYDSIRNNDINVAMASFLLSLFSILLFSLAADLVSLRVDPRLSHD
ncbi:MAG: hypothetical protein RJB66_1827 [Pseudomonadota bacterium]